MPTPEDLPPDSTELPRARPTRRPRRDDDDYDDDDYDGPPPRNRKYDDEGNEITSDHQMWAIFAHVGVFVVGFFAPLIIMFVFADKSRFVSRHARESLNHQITIILLMFLILFLAVGIGFAVYGVSDSPPAGLITGYVLFIIGSIALSIKNIIVIILATLAASKYRHYRYPMSIRLLG